MRGSLEEGEEFSSTCPGRNNRIQVLFDWLMGMSLERTGVEELGSDEGGLSGTMIPRVIVPSGLRTI